MSTRLITILRPYLIEVQQVTLGLLFLIVLSAIVASPAQALELDSRSLVECKSIEAGFETANLLPYLFHFVDDDEKIEIDHLEKAHALENEFESISFKRIQQHDGEYVLGGSGSDHWLRFCLSNTSNGYQDLVLNTHPANFAEIDFYPQKKGLPIFRTGYKRPYSSRDIQGAKYHFNIVLAPNESQTFYIRLNTRAQAFITVKLDQKNKYEYNKSILENLDGLYAGVLLCTILYALFICIWGRQRYALFYFLWCASGTALFLAIDGRLIQFFRVDDTQPLLILSFFLYPLTSVLSALFAREFIKLKQYSTLDKVGLSIILVFSSIFLMLVWGHHSGLAIKSSALFGLVVCCYFGIAAPIYAIAKDNSVLAKYLLIAQMPMFVCFVDRAALALGLTPQYYIPYTPKVGLGIFMVLMAIFSGIRAYQEKKEAQQLAIESLEQTNELKSNYNQRLESEVLEKTAEIQSINKKLEHKSAKLMELDEIKSTFFTNISHEFRTPITLIQGPLTQLLEQPKFPSKGVLKSVINQADNLKKLVDQLLLLSKFDNQSLDLMAQKVKVGEVVRRLYSQFESLAGSRNIKLTFEDESHKVEAYLDLEKLSVIINNLINNAIKFTDDGGRIHIMVSASNLSNDDDFTTDEYVNIQVSDTGSGISEKDAHHIFDRFYQSQSSPLTSAGVGTGIGLALVKELTQLHTGTVELIRHESQLHTNEHELNPVTEFLLKFPLGKAHLHPNELVITEAPAITKDHSGETSKRSDGDKHQAMEVSHKPAPSSAHTILIVDDNADMRLYLRSLLEMEYQLVEAKDGLEAKKLVARSAPDLVLTDLMMPKHDGLSFVTTLKQDMQFQHIPIIMITAKARQDDRLAGLTAEVDDYLSKPFDARELKLKIKNLLKKQSQKMPATASNESANCEPERGSNGQPAENKFVTKAQELIQANIANPKFGVSQLAEQLHVSRATLNRRISGETQLTASEFVRYCRLEAAQKLLAQGSVHTIKELAAAVGFNQPAYFSRLYQTTYGHSPFSETSE